MTMLMIMYAVLAAVVADDPENGDNEDEDIVPAVPAAHALHEGSVWDLADPAATIVFTRRSRTTTLDLHDWVQRHTNDPWRGVEPAVLFGTTAEHDHEAPLPVHVGQRITILGSPIWLWSTTDMVAGEYAVPATTDNRHNVHYNSYHALLGLVPRSRLLTRTAPRLYDV